MEMFNIGGLKDEGGTKDPVSGNNVPSGSLKEEVRDDIDAKLSPGEFVFPADVTRFLGLRFLMELRDKAKAGLQRMEDMGQMGNSEEAVLDEDVPFEQSDLIIVAGSPMEEQMNKMNAGGMPIHASNGVFATSQQQQSNQAGGVPGRGDQLLGSNLRQYFNPATNEVRSVLVSRDNLTGELKPVTPLEQGFILDTPENRTKSMGTQSQQTSARVETTRPKKERSSMDPDVAGIGVNEMTMTERAAIDIPESVRGIVSGAVSLGVAGLGGFLGNVGQEAAKKTGMIDETVRDLMSKKMTNDFSLMDEARAKLAAMTPAQRAAQKARDAETIADRATRDYMDSIGASQGMRDDTVSVMGTIGGIKGPLSVDLRSQVVTDPLTGDVIGGKDGKKALELAKERKAKEEVKTITSLEKSFGPTPEPPSEPIGMSGGVDAGPSGPAAGPAAGDPMGMGGGPQNEEEAQGGGQSFTYKGGFISKKKKQKKKMKRGGLASR